MSFHAFNRAIVRTPSRSVSDGLRAVDIGAPNYEGVLREHTNYLRALEALGVKVEALPALEEFPDSVFVEDTALVFAGAAILLRPGAPTRRGEAAEMAATLERNFERVLRLEDGTAEGGDVLATPRAVFIGASARTSIPGAAALVSLLAQIGQQGVVVNTPPGVLHLKSDCSMLDEETILCTPRLAAAQPFPGFRPILTPEGEEGAANALRIGDALRSLSPNCRGAGAGGLSRYADGHHGDRQDRRWPLLHVAPLEGVANRRKYIGNSSERRDRPRDAIST